MIHQSPDAKRAGVCTALPFINRSPNCTLNCHFAGVNQGRVHFCIMSMI